MKTLYEFLVKQHTNNYEYNEKDNAFELYAFIDNYDKVFILIDNIVKWEIFIHICKYKHYTSYPENFINTCEKLINNGKMLLITLYSNNHETNWIVYDKNGTSKKSLDYEFATFDEYIGIEDFTIEYWKNHNWNV